MSALRFDNAFVRELPGDDEAGPRRRQVHGALYSRVDPEPVASPRLIAVFAPTWLRCWEFGDADVASPEFAQVFGGNELLDGMQPYAANYGGHQFGNWAGQLGDGRAITLGETINATGDRWELQLKGAGPTPYARSADGRAVLRSSVREFLCSEAMHHLGVPTTRALCLVATGSASCATCSTTATRRKSRARSCAASRHRSSVSGTSSCRPRAATCRCSRNSSTSPSAAIFRSCSTASASEAKALPEAIRAEWFGQVCERTAVMIAHWMRVGFVHGVMNTDNMSILGLTIDYGPYGWIDNFDPDWTPNTTDAHGRRYRFGQQAQIAYWNLTRLANALMPVLSTAEPLHAGLQRYVDAFTAAERANVAAKLGLAECLDEDLELMAALHELLVTAEVDMTIFFRALADVDLGGADARADARRVLRRGASSATPSPHSSLGSARYASARARATDVAGFAPGCACMQPTRATCCATTSRSRRSTAPSRATMPASTNCRTSCAAHTTISPAASGLRSGDRTGRATGRVLDAVVQLLIG